MLITDRLQTVTLTYTGELLDPKTRSVLRPALAPDHHAKFTCRLLTGSEFVRTMDSGALSGSAMLQAATWCLKAWENVRSAETGEPIPWPGKAYDALDMLPGDVVAWLGAELLGASALQRDDLAK